jgi:hypothetical protein
MVANITINPHWKRCFDRLHAKRDRGIDASSNYLPYSKGDKLLKVIFKPYVGYKRQCRCLLTHTFSNRESCNSTYEPCLYTYLFKAGLLNKQIRCSCEPGCLRETQTVNCFFSTYKETPFPVELVISHLSINERKDTASSPKCAGMNPSLSVIRNRQVRPTW